MAKIQHSTGNLYRKIIYHKSGPLDKMSSRQTSMKQNTLWRAVFDLTGVILIQNRKGPTWFLRYQSSPSEDYSVAAQKKELYHLLFDFCTINILGVKSQKQAILA